jgi:hypothetical protein
MSVTIHTMQTTWAALLMRMLLPTRMPTEPCSAPTSRMRPCSAATPLPDEAHPEPACEMTPA